MDILGYLKNTHKNPKFGKVRQIPIREFPTKVPNWDLSHSSKFGIFVGILYQSISKMGIRYFFLWPSVRGARTTTKKKRQKLVGGMQKIVFFANSPLAVSLPRIRGNPAQSFASCAHFRARVPRSELRPLKYLKVA